MNLSDLDTPALILDRRRLVANEQYHVVDGW
jgi:hypothetical protein